MNNIEDKKQKENNEMDNNNVHVSSIVAFLVSLAIIIGGIFGALYFLINMMMIVV